MAVLPTADRFRRVSPPLRRLALLLTVGALVTAVAVPVLAREADLDEVPVAQPGDGGSGDPSAGLPEELVNKFRERGVPLPGEEQQGVEQPVIPPDLEAQLRADGVLQPGAEIPTGPGSAAALSALAGFVVGGGNGGGVQSGATDAADVAVGVAALGAAATAVPSGLEQAPDDAPNLDLSAPETLQLAPVEGSPEAATLNDNQGSPGKVAEQVQDGTTPPVPVAIASEQGASPEQAATTPVAVEGGDADKAAAQGGPKVHAQVSPDAGLQTGAGQPLSCAERDCWWQDPPACAPRLDAAGACLDELGRLIEDWTGVNPVASARDLISEAILTEPPPPAGPVGPPGPGGDGTPPSGEDGTTTPGGGTPPATPDGATTPGATPVPSASPAVAGVEGIFSAATSPEAVTAWPPDPGAGLAKMCDADLPALPPVVSTDPLVQDSIDRVYTETVPGGQEMACETEEVWRAVQDTASSARSLVQQPSIEGLWDTLERGGHALREAIDPTRDPIHVPERRLLLRVRQKLEELGVLPSIQVLGDPEGDLPAVNAPVTAS